MNDWQLWIVLPIVAWAASLIGFRGYRLARSVWETPTRSARQTSGESSRPSHSPCQGCLVGCQSRGTSCSSDVLELQPPSRHS